MKKHRILNSILALATILALALMSGCGGESAGGQTTPVPANPTTAPTAAPTAAPTSAPTAAPTAAPTEAPSAAPTAAPETPAPPQEDGSHRVESTEELLEAIRPGADIRIAAGYYDLTDFLLEILDREAWNEAHEYVAIHEEYDGPELVIQGVTGLRIAGDSDDPAATELTVDPRYAAVMHFSDCAELELDCLTMGHTELGDCVGNVLQFDRCRGIRLNKVDLYGCGVYGIGCNDSGGDLEVRDSVIRDCAFGPFEIYDGVGEFRFENCAFTGSGWGGSFEFNENSTLSFIGCFFGEQESNAWYFDDFAEFADCEWSEITEYPDYSEYGDWTAPELDPYNVTMITIDEDSVKNSYWAGYAQMNPESFELRNFVGGEEAVYEYAGLKFYDDDSGWLELQDQLENFSWECRDEQTVILTSEEGMYFVNFYVSEGENGGYTVWALLYYGDELIWFY